MAAKKISGHFQTLLGHWVPSPRLDLDGEKHIIELSDGDRLVGFFYKGSSDVLVSLYHGLSGDIDADYMQRTAIQYLALGHSVFLVNHRGAGAGAGLAKKPYHSGRAEDVSAVIHYLRDLHPHKKQIAAGFSMSGNIILFLLSGQKGEHLPDGAITVNAPINLQSCSEKLGQGLNRAYDLRFVRRIVEQKALNISPWSRLTTVDDLYTAPICGFRDRHDYYQTCSAKPYVSKIQVPSCVLTSADDPFVPVEDYLEALWSEAVDLKIQPWGGHLGYISAKRNSLGTHRWLDEYMVESLQRLLLRV